MTTRSRTIAVILILISNAHSMLIKIEHHNRQQQAFIIQNIFYQKYGIPKDLIEITEVEKPCLKIDSNRAAHLCLDDQMELHLLHYNEKLLIDATNVFRRIKQ